jgi:hypothetical protein
MQGNCKVFLMIKYIFFKLPLGLVNQFKPIFFTSYCKAMEKKQRGGPRPNSGRPPKIQEIKLIEQMDAIAVPEKIWLALLRKCEEGDTQALKLWLSYRLGLPKQQIDITSNGEKVAPPIHWISKTIEIQEAQLVEDETHTRIDE